MYASQEILLGSSSGSSSSSEPSTTAGQGFGGDSAPSPSAAAAEKGDADAESEAGTPRKRTPAQLLLDEIMVTDADKWDGVLAGLSAPGSMTGGVTKEGLLGAIQASIEGFCAGVVLLEEVSEPSSAVQTRQPVGCSGWLSTRLVYRRRKLTLLSCSSVVCSASAAQHSCGSNNIWSCDVDYCERKHSAYISYFYIFLCLSIKLHVIPLIVIFSHATTSMSKLMRACPPCRCPPAG